VPGLFLFKNLQTEKLIVNIKKLTLLNKETKMTEHDQSMIELLGKYSERGTMGLFCPSCGGMTLSSEVNMSWYESKCMHCGYVLNSRNPHYHQEILRGFKAKLAKIPQEIAEFQKIGESEEMTEWAKAQREQLETIQAELTQLVSWFEPKGKKSRKKTKAS
jgi:DNA-directed RNA polymerase subunit M/transcription elongation factor TFIIS